MVDSLLGLGEEKGGEGGENTNPNGQDQQQQQQQEEEEEATSFINSNDEEEEFILEDPSKQLYISTFHWIACFLPS